jgi:putative ABC transport system ATP-binding protein
LEPNLFKYIWRHSRGEQLVILGVVLASQLFYFLSLDLPKTIVNKAIQGDAFSGGQTTAPFLELTVSVPDFLSGLFGTGSVTLFDGLPLAQVPYLVALSLLFFVLVIINGVFKLQINTQKGRMGERMLRRLRFELFDCVLRFPHLQFRKVKQAEIATMIKDEVEPLGGFIGDAFVQPAFLGGQALTALAFIITQSVWLGGVTVGILVLQGAIIPKLRVKVLKLGKARQITARQLAGRIAECVDGSADIHVHDTSNYERADIADRLGRIFDIRFELYQRKFAVKFLNNMLAQLTPFFFYLVGGYLAITGRLDIGGLVAVIAAYKDLPGPVKELIDWDQQRQDVQIKYEQVIDQFQPEGMLAEELQRIDAPSEPLTGDIVFANLSIADEGGGRLVEGLGAKIDLAEHVAVVGGAGSGREAVALALSRLVEPLSGSVSIGGRDLFELPETVTGRRLSYAGTEPYLFPLNVRENLLYGLRHRPLGERNYEGEAKRYRDVAVREAKRSGNPTFDVAADWIDYEAAGVANAEELEARLIEVLKLVDLEEDVYQLGLRGTINPAERPNLAAAIIEARADLGRRLADPQFSALVEPFNPERYNKNLSVAENLLFGTARGDEFAPDNLPSNAYLRQTLERAGLAEDILAMGRQIAETMVELFADLPAGHPFFEQFSFISAEDLPEFRTLLAQIGKTGLGQLDAGQRAKLMRLPFPYVEARHRLGLIDETMERRLLEARRQFAANLPDALKPRIEFYNHDRYNAAASLQDNILFGRLVFGQAQAAARIGRLIGEVLDQRQMRPAVLAVGLDFQVGIAGKRLTASQRQKIGLARALIKRPQMLVLNEAINLLDGQAQGRVAESVRKMRQGQGLIWVLHRADLARSFDRILVLKDGRLVEQGRPAELDRPGSAFTQLLTAE